VSATKQGAELARSPVSCNPLHNTTSTLLTSTLHIDQLGTCLPGGANVSSTAVPIVSVGQPVSPTKPGAANLTSYCLLCLMQYKTGQARCQQQAAYLFAWWRQRVIHCSANCTLGRRPARVPHQGRRRQLDMLLSSLSNAVQNRTSTLLTASYVPVCLVVPKEVCSCNCKRRPASVPNHARCHQL
jgi:hypothetical protein